MPLWTKGCGSLHHSTSLSEIFNERESSSGNTAKQNSMTKQNEIDGHELRKKMGQGESEPDSSNEAYVHSQIESVPLAHPSEAQLDRNARAFSKEIDDIFESFGNFGTGRGDAEEDEPDVYADISNAAKDPGRQKVSALEQGTEIIGESTASSTTTAANLISSSAHDNITQSNAHEKVESSNEMSSLKSPIGVTPIRPAIRRKNSSSSRRRNRPIHQMESISETGNNNSSTLITSEETKEFEDGDTGFLEDLFNQDGISEENRLSNIDINDHSPTVPRSESPVVTTDSTSSSFSTPRRRLRASSEGPTASVGENSDSSGSGRGSRGPGSRHGRRRRRFEGSNCPAESRETNNDDSDRRERYSSSGNTLVASLDAGMATLRRWVRTRRLSFGSGSGGAGGSSGHSVSSMTTMRLGEEDIFALSQTGSDPRGLVATTEAYTSSDPNTMNIFDSNSSSGFLYYRPFEVHVHHDIDTDSGLYGSDDESGNRSVLLHPLVPSTESGSLDEASSQQSRQRAHSEPDRARIVDFFSSVYGSRAIDGGNMQGGTVDEERDHQGSRPMPPSQHRSSSMRPAVMTSQIAEEETDVPEQDIGPTRDQLLAANDITSTRLQLISSRDDDGRPHISPLEAPDATISNSSSTSRNPSVLPLPGGELDPDITSINDLADNNTEETPGTSPPNTADPNQRARIRWMRINRRFRCMITSVAVLFSLLLFFIVIAWVLLTSTYVLSHNKTCDVPLRGYFWLATFQLMLDIFRADIMKWLCRWRIDSGQRIPPRIIIYNFAYLVYAMLVLRLGVRSVFITESTCYNTAPELFYASLVFICLSLVAWATILLGYLIPFVFVAVLLTRNGYFPNGDIASSRGVMGGRRARVGTGRISDMVGEVFPNTYSNPAPPGCVDRLRVVLLHEFPDSYQRECCICMMEYKDGEVIVATPCGHVFHKRCCREWLQLSRTCPVCRTDLPESLGMEPDGPTGEDQSREMRDQNNGPRGNITEQRERSPREVRNNLMHFLQRQSAGNTSSSHHESAVVIELPDSADQLTTLDV